MPRVGLLSLVSVLRNETFDTTNINGPKARVKPDNSARCKGWRMGSRAVPESRYLQHKVRSINFPGSGSGCDVKDIREKLDRSLTR